MTDQLTGSQQVRVKERTRTNRQGLKRQLVEAGDIDGWLAGATKRSYLPDIAGKGTCETTTAKSPAACTKVFGINCNIFITFTVR